MNPRLHPSPPNPPGRPRRPPPWSAAPAPLQRLAALIGRYTRPAGARAQVSDEHESTMDSPCL